MRLCPEQTNHRQSWATSSHFIRPRQTLLDLTSSNLIRLRQTPSDLERADWIHEARKGCTLHAGHSLSASPKMKGRCCSDACRYERRTSSVFGQLASGCKRYCDRMSMGPSKYWHRYSIFGRFPLSLFGPKTYPKAKAASR